jgi:hypothetical protein
MTHLQMFTTQTPYTDFGKWDDLGCYAENTEREFPIKAIEVANKMLVHYSNSEFKKLEPERAADLNLRSVSEIIDRYLELNQGDCQNDDSGTPVAGRCRDLALLICSQFRNRNIPARLRFGFSHMYYKTNLAITDHVVVEYYQDGEWKLLEPRATMALIEKENLDINPVEIERKRFILGSRAWTSVRNKKMRAEWFSGTTPNAEAGLWYIRKIMLYDLSSLCRYEPDIFDTWGYLTDSKPGVMPKYKPHLQALDEMADIDVYDENEFLKLHQLLVNDERFLPDGEIKVNPIIGRPSSVPVAKSDYVIY